MTASTIGRRPEEEERSERHRRRAAMHARLAQVAGTAGERRMQEDLADLHARLAASTRGRDGRPTRRPGARPH